MAMILSFLNPIKLAKAFIYHKKTSKHIKASNDLELHFYSKILKNDMLKNLNNFFFVIGNIGFERLPGRGFGFPDQL